jgi:hypothetical protein
MLSFLGFGKKTEAPVGYNKGKVSEVTNVSSSPVQVTRLLNDASNEVEDGNGSPGCRMSTADAPSSPSYLISGLNLEDTVSEPLHSARSVESNASRRSTSSRRSVNSKARGGDQSTKLTARSAIPEGDEEGKPSNFSWDDLRGMTMEHRRKTIDIWRLTSMPRKEFWEERRKRFEGVPLDPIKKQSDSEKDCK